MCVASPRATPRLIRSRGFTLAEALIAVALAAIVTALGAMLISTMLRGYARGRTRSDLQSQAQVVCQTLEADLRTCAPAAISIYNGARSDPQDVVAVAVQRIEGTMPPDGLAMWQTTLLVYVWNPATRTVVRREVARDDPRVQSLQLSAKAPRHVPDDLLRRLAAGSGQSDRLLAREVDALEVTAGADPTLMTMPITIRVVAARHSTAYSADGERAEAFARIRPRNRT